VRNFGLPHPRHIPIDLNNAAVTESLLPDSIVEAELFGHEAGAFAGAARRRIGRIEHAHRGTLFLDEIESMPLSLQVKLLRVLQERLVEPLGSNEQVAQCPRAVQRRGPLRSRAG
jgi:transcriptional regulator with PAS, ATPase and Fis domain